MPNILIRKPIALLQAEAEETEVALPPRVLGVLEALLRRPGEVVARHELLDQVWKDAFVTDTSLAEAVSVLRQALGDDPQSPTYVQTVHRRGYRFVAPVDADQGRTGIKPQSDGEHTRSAGTTLLSSAFIAWTIAIFATALAISAIWNVARMNAIQPAPITRFDIRPAAGSWFDRRAPAFAVAPDGRSVAWAACEGTSGTCGLFVRPIDRLEAIRLAGTDGAQAPFFSPDGRWLGFFADGKLKKVAVSGGSPVVLADAPSAGGGSWNDEGEIVFSGLPAGGLAVTSDQGGEVTTITTPHAAKGEVRHAWPSWTPGNRTILFTIVGSPVPGAPGQVGVKNVGASTWRTLRSGVSRAMPAGAGYLLVSSGGDLRALSYDERTLTPSGSSDAVLDALADADGVPQFAAAGGGALVALRSGPARRTIEWSDAPGRPLTNAARLSQLTLSPDGGRAAGVIADAAGSDVWTVDLTSGALTRVTFSGTNVSPVWTPSGRLIYAARAADGPFAISSLGSTRSDGHLFPASVTPDGRVVTLKTSSDGHVSLAIAGPDGTRPIITGPFDVLSAAISPDGSSIAYGTDETGRNEVYVRRLDDSTRTQISTAGGEDPSWTADGRAVFFHEGERFISIAIDRDGRPRSDSREVILDRPDARVIGVAPNGRLLIERRPLPLDGAIVILQWLRELQQRSPLPVNPPR